MLLERLLPTKNQRQRDALALAEGSLLIILGIFVYVFLPQQVAFNRAQRSVPLPQGPVAQTAVDAYASALSKAKAWDVNPKLVSISSNGGTLDALGRSTFFRVWFSSGTRENMGYEVIVQDGQIRGEGEFVLFKRGGVLANVISEQEVIGKMRAIPGYEDEEVAYTELSYQDNAKTWIWAVKPQNHAVVTFEAEKK